LFVDRLLTSNGVYKVKRACNWIVREPDSPRIVLVVALSILAFTILFWVRPKPAEPNPAVRIKPMVSPQEMRNVLSEAERSRQRARHPAAQR
jgi:hypothetical protein